MQGRTAYLERLGVARADVARTDPAALRLLQRAHLGTPAAYRDEFGIVLDRVPTVGDAPGNAVSNAVTNPAPGASPA